ncbi:Predicted membrane protein [Mycobacterium tuberculosis]|nr:Predicted membrane protein [Mycobacterium tuberculosis]
MEKAESLDAVAAPTGARRGARRLRAAPADRLHLVLMLALTFSTGIVDAVGFLGLDRVFTGNMTGNVVILGMAIAGGGDLPVMGPLLALLGFMAGAALAGWRLREAEPGWPPQATAFFALAALLVMTTGVGLVCMGGSAPGPTEITLTTILGSAMGLQAATARHIAVKDVTTVVVTSTITAFSGGLVRGAGGSGKVLDRRLAAVALILVGAAVGAASLRWQLGAGLILAGTVLAVVAAVGAWHARAGA